MKRAVWVTGATGFLGRRIVPALRGRGHEVVALARDAQRASRLPELASSRIHQGDVLDPASLRGAADGVHTVVHLIGILRESAAEGYQEVVVDGTAAVLAEARRASARRILFVSALGADRWDEVAYFRTKGLAEEMVRTSGLAWLVLRCSVVLGEGAEFVRMLRRLARFPVVPVPGSGRQRLQPVHVDDVAEIVARAVDEAPLWNRCHAVCGPRVLRLRELLRLAARGPRVFLPLPLPLLALGAWLARRLLPSPPITPDELAMLRRGSACDSTRVERDFGIVLRPVEAVVSGRAA